MVHYVYAVRDSKTTFGSPFVDSSDGSARRGFEYSFRNSPGLVNFSPADFSLYRIGTFDSDSGALTAELPVYICSATDFVGGVPDAE